MSQFDPEAFLSAQFDEANDTVMQPVPAGEYTAIIESVSTRQWNSRDGSKSGVALDVKYNIDDAAVKEALGRSKITVTQGIMLDLTENGGLDFGKGRNISLGRLREATGLNTPGKPFAFRQLEGQPVKITVSHRVVEDQIYADVKGVAKLA